jgi:hypothetical protein
VVLEVTAHCEEEAEEDEADLLACPVLLMLPSLLLAEGLVELDEGLVELAVLLDDDGLVELALDDGLVSVLEDGLVELAVLLEDGLVELLEPMELVELLLRSADAADEPLIPVELLDGVAQAASTNVPEYFCVRASAMLPEDVVLVVELAPLELVLGLVWLEVELGLVELGLVELGLVSVEG